MTALCRARPTPCSRSATRLGQPVFPTGACSPTRRRTRKVRRTAAATTPSSISTCAWPTRCFEGPPGAYEALAPRPRAASPLSLGSPSSASTRAGRRGPEVFDAVRLSPLFCPRTVDPMPPTATIQAAARSSTKPRAASRWPFLEAHPGMDVEDGYAIQRRGSASWPTVAASAVRSASRRGDAAGEPDRRARPRVLLDDMFFEQGSDIPFARFIAPRVEVELAFVLGRLKGRAVTLFGRARRPSTSCRRSRSSTPSSSSTARRSSRARSSTPSPISPPTPASSSAAVRCGR